MAALVRAGLIMDERQKRTAASRRLAKWAAASGWWVLILAIFGWLAGVRTGPRLAYALLAVSVIMGAAVVIFTKDQE